jgi:hypothetical protein
VRGDICKPFSDRGLGLGIYNKILDSMPVKPAADWENKQRPDEAFMT